MSETKGVPTFLVKKITPRLLISTLKLFNAFPITELKKEKVSKKLTELTMDHGFIYSPQVVGNYKEPELISYIELVEKEIGISPSQMNASFHKSWKKVRDAPIFQLVLEQVFHYITTYGYESLGVYDQNTVFIPHERLDLPNLDSDIKLSFVKGYTVRQLKAKLLAMLESGIALNNMEDILEIANFCGIKEKDISEIKNKEVRIRLYQKFELIPENPIEFLRLILLETGNELLITNKKTIENIKKAASSNVKIYHMFKVYDKQYGYNKLAEIFLRFKRLFLAFKGGNMSPIINRISVLSKTYHKPLTPSLLNDITGLLKNHEIINKQKLNKELDNVNIFRKIRLLNALRYRVIGNENILYKIRNGKSYAKTISFDNVKGAEKIYEIILKSIIKDLSYLKGKKVYIPENITYALPSTAKQFTGNIPSGSCVTIPKDLIFGVYWNNVNNRRIDLDLSVISVKNGKIGWNARYRSDNILFSGDMTDATNGASELFYINKDYEDIMVMFLNYYNGYEDGIVPYKIVVGEEHTNTFGLNYMINPNNIKCVSKSEVKGDAKNKILGLVSIKKGECKFFFSESTLGNSIVSSSGKYNDITREYFVNYFTNMVTLNEVLESVGAKIISEPTKDCINLSPESIEKDTFIKLLTG